MDAIHGVTIERLAETMAKHNELKAKYGEREFSSHFDTYLAGVGLNQNVWADAWNGWHTRMTSDPSGALRAKFHMLESELSRKAHFGDVADMSQDVKGGVSLDTYAYVMAKIAGGGEAKAILAEKGLSDAVWQAGQAAWGAAMANDTMHKITTQYGELYAKHNPAFNMQAMMQAEMQRIHQMEQAGGANAADEPPKKDRTFDDFLVEIKDAVPAKRWKAAHDFANQLQTSMREDSRHKAGIAAVAPVLIDCLERHDKNTASNAEAAARDLIDLEVFTDDVRGAIARCLSRGQDHLRNLRAAFEPIRDKNVPERVYMQTEIQDYESLTEELPSRLEDFDSGKQRADEEAAEASAQSSVATNKHTPSTRTAAGSASAGSPHAIAPTQPGGGLLDALIRVFPFLAFLRNIFGK